MSAIVATLGADFAAVSNDTLCTDRDGRPLAFVDKLVVVPRLGMAVAGRGDHALFQAWVSTLMQGPLWRDVEDVLAGAPVALRALATELRDAAGLADVRMELFHFGWSADDDAPMGFLCRSEVGFEARVLEPGTHTMAPEPRHEAPFGLQVWSGWEGARHGAGVDEFHAHVARNQHAAVKAGMHGQTWGIGGDLVHAWIDGDGVHTRVLMTFDDAAETEAAIVAGLDAGRSFEDSFDWVGGKGGTQ